MVMSPVRVNSYLLDGKLYETPQGKRMTGAELERIFAEEENRLNELQKQAVENLTKQEKKEEDTEDNATKSADSDNSTPPKLFLGYVSMVNLPEPFLNGCA